MVEVEVGGIKLDASSQSYVVILQEKGGKGVLPIWIGRPEAESIVVQMNDVKRERPMTHDLCKNLVVGLGGTLTRVQITKVQKNTYYAELYIQRDGALVQIDARPSDSIAIALRLQAPIFAQESLLTGGTDGDDATDDEPDLSPPPAPDELRAEALKRHLERMRPEDFGKFNL